MPSFGSRISFVRMLRVVNVWGSALERVSQTAALSLLVGGWLVAARFIDRKVIEQVRENSVGNERYVQFY